MNRMVTDEALATYLQDRQAAPFWRRFAPFELEPAARLL